MDVRKAKLSDIDEIFNLGSAVNEFEVSDEVVTFWPEKILKRCVKSKTDFIFIAEENSEIVGFVIANYNPNFSKAIIENIFVKPEFRGQNIGKKLLESLLDQLEKVNCEYVCALVESKDEPAIGFYVKNNFNRGINCVWLDKILAKSFKK